MSDKNAMASARPGLGSRIWRGMGDFYNRWFIDWWVWELVGAFFTGFFALALAMTLWTYNGQAVPNFGSLFSAGITLGTFVAVLGTLTVAVAATPILEGLGQLKWLWFYKYSRPLSDLELYDQATRDSWSAIRLMWRLRLVHSPFAVIGAFLMILDLLVVPLAQQSISYVTQGAPDVTQKALVPIAQTWSDLTTSTAIRGMPLGYNTIGAGIKGAILSGLFAGNTVLNNTLPSCGSGNCTYNDVSSLGVCSYSANVTAQLQRSGSSWCLPGGFCLPQGTTNATGAASQVIANVMTGIQPMQNTQISAAANATLTVPLNFTSAAFADHKNPLSDVYILYNSGNTASGTPQAIEFVLDWCVPVFSATAINGTVNTTRKSATMLNMPFDPNASNTTKYNSTVNGTLYAVDRATHHTLQRYFLQRLNGTAALATQNATTYADSDEVQVLCDTLHILDTTTSGGALSSTGANVTGLNVLLQNTATSMTNFIRTTRNGVVSPIILNGTALVQQNVLVVSWGWVVPPCMFAILTIIFTLFVVCCAGGHLPRRRKGVVRPRVWKTSNLASLQGLDSDLHHALGPMGRVTETEKTADAIYARLAPEGNGWRLVREIPRRTQGDEVQPYGEAVQAWEAAERLDRRVDMQLPTARDENGRIGNIAEKAAAGEDGGIDLARLEAHYVGSPQTHLYQPVAEADADHERAFRS